MPSSNSVMDLSARGWRVHPLFALTEQGVCTCELGAACQSPGKHPHVKSWNKAATTDEEVIEEWWSRWPKSNVAVVMGPTSGIIDLEADSPEAEQFIRDLFDNEPILTPTFTSSRGTHRLFRFTDSLPHSDKAHWRLPGIDLDFKIGNNDAGTYCVFPPSRHQSGAVYSWTIHPDDCDVAELPPYVIAKLHAIATEGTLNTSGPRRSQEHWDHVLTGVGEGERNESAASLIGRLVAAMADPGDTKQQRINWTLVKTWNQLNRPPLEESELKTIFQSILDRHLANRTKRTFSEPTPVPEKEEDNPAPGWKLVRVEADPPYYKLYSPRWPDRFVRLSDSQLLNPHFIRLEAQSQCCVGLEPSFKKFWDGSKNNASAYAYLMATIAVEAADFDERLENVLAYRLFEHFQDATEDDQPAMGGRPTRIEESIWFTLSYLRTQDRVLSDNEYQVVRLLKQVCDPKSRVRRVRDGQHRFKTISPDGLKRLKEMAFYGAEHDEDDGALHMEQGDVSATY